MTFKKAFLSAPQVLYSIYSIDVKNQQDAPLDIDVTITDITATGFSINYYAYSERKINSILVSWFAHNDAFSFSNTFLLDQQSLTSTSLSDGKSNKVDYVTFPLKNLFVTGLPDTFSPVASVFLVGVSVSGSTESVEAKVVCVNNQ